jgi:hypothetical protein
MQTAISAPADERHVWVQAALLWQLLGNTNDVRTTGLHQDAPTW